MKPTEFAIISVGAYFLMQKYSQSVVNTAAQNNNMQAFLALIRKFESGGRYDVIYGGKTFSDYSRHPNIRVPFQNPATGNQDYSTAAGAYQITYTTWLTINAALSLPDFSPQNQDNAAILLLSMRGVTPLIVAGNLDAALQKASGTWASLPYSTSGQAKQSVASAQQVYLSSGGQIA